jgi:thiamine-phosphate pyrophosphorylase
VKQDRYEGLDVLYPIVPDAGWLKRLVPLGVRTIQLRLKGAGTQEICRQIGDSLETCMAHDCQLIVNDHWREAISIGADYVHLGQDDLAAADLATIKAAGVRLGVSTHSAQELETALAAEPDYVALGPVYPTRLKVMRWAPQGLGRVTEWARRIAPLPLVAIAGMTPERAPGVLAAGAASVAVLTDIVSHADPEARVRTWLAWAERARAERGQGGLARRAQ